MGFLSGLGDFFLGTKPSVHTRKTSRLNTTQTNLLKQVLSPYISQPIWESAPAYGGSFSAPLSNLQNLSLAGLENLASGKNATLTSARGAVSDIASGKGGPNFQSAVAAPLEKTFRESTLPAILGTYAKTGHLQGSDRIKATNLAARDLGNTLSTQAQRYALAEQANRLRAAQLAPLLTVSPLMSELQAGAVPQSTAQRSVAGKYADFIRQQKQHQARARLLAAVLGIPMSKVDTVVTPGTSGFLTSLAGGVGKGVGMAAGAAAF